MSSRRPCVSSFEPGVSYGQSGVSDGQSGVSSVEPGVSSGHECVSEERFVGRARVRVVSSFASGVSSGQSGVSVGRSFRSSFELFVSSQLSGVSSSPPGVSSRRPGVSTKPFCRHSLLLGVSSWRSARSFRRCWRVSPRTKTSSSRSTSASRLLKPVNRALRPHAAAPRCVGSLQEDPFVPLPLARRTRGRTRHRRRSRPVTSLSHRF